MSVPPAGRDAPSAQPPFLQELQSLWRELPGLVGDRVELFELEARQAGGALAQMALLAVAALLLAVTAWGLLWALAVSLLLQAGLLLWGALLIAVAVNAVVAAALALRLNALVPRLELPATRRHLGLRPSSKLSPAAPPQAEGPSRNPVSSTAHDSQPVQ